MNWCGGNFFVSEQIVVPIFHIRYLVAQLFFHPYFMRRISHDLITQLRTGFLDPGKKKNNFAGV
jgi:hypothetical protein